MRSVLKRCSRRGVSMSSEIRLIAIVTVNGEDFIRGLRMEPHGRSGKVVYGHCTPYK